MIGPTTGRLANVDIRTTSRSCGSAKLAWIIYRETATVVCSSQASAATEQSQAENIVHVMELIREIQHGLLPMIPQPECRAELVRTRMANTENLELKAKKELYEIALEAGRPTGHLEVR